MAGNPGRVSRHMVHPQLHPKSKVYRFRQAVPASLRGAVGEVLGRPGQVRELIRSLETRDFQRAKQLMPAAQQWANEVLDAARNGGRTLSERDIHALSGTWYRRRLAEWEADPALALGWDGWEQSIPEPAYAGHGDAPGCEADDFDPGQAWDARWGRFLDGYFLPEARALVAGEGIAASAESLRRLAGLLVQRMGQALAQHHRERAGDYSPDTRLATFPALQRPPTPAPAPTTAPIPELPAVSFTTLLAGWRTTTNNKARTVDEVVYAVAALVAFVGHDDAARMARADLVRWRETQKAEGRSNNTWNNRLSLVRQVFAHGVAEGVLPADPTDGLRLRRNRVKSPLPYTNEDARQLLLAARKETRPSLRWAHWVMAFTGMRAGEVLQLTGGDVREDEGIPYLAIHEDGAGRSVKTGQKRNVPCHDALIREGFIAYAQTVKADAPIFPDKQPDKHGNRGGRAWNVVGKWARAAGGITDPAKAPDHSWRHRVEDELRAAAVPEDVRDAITGHAKKITGRQYGVRGEALGRLAEAVNKMKSPLDVR